MVDPFEALVSFQDALRRGDVEIQPGSVDSNLFVHLDQPHGVTRLTYVRLDKRLVTAFANFSICDPMKGKPCFQAGVAVPPKLRKQGRAKDVLAAAIAELSAGLARNGVQTFYLEAIVDEENAASKRVAEAVFSPNPTAIVDEFTNRPSFQYLLKVSN